MPFWRVDILNYIGAIFQTYYKNLKKEENVVADWLYMYQTNAVYYALIYSSAP